jgi:hypothetical protein
MSRQPANTQQKQGSGGGGGGGKQQHNGDLFKEDAAQSGAPDFYQRPSGAQNASFNNDDDLYDFSNTKPRGHLESSSNNATDDEEEDINFDYAYGFDYERVIKDRLKQVNHELNNNKDDVKRKSAVVSFDNAVTAVDIPPDTDTESQGE